MHGIRKESQASRDKSPNDFRDRDGQVEDDGGKEPKTAVPVVVAIRSTMQDNFFVQISAGLLKIGAVATVRDLPHLAHNVRDYLAAEPARAGGLFFA